MKVVWTKCPTCGDAKDSRAKQCRVCQCRDRPQRLGTGAPRRVTRNGYVVVCVNRRPVYEHRNVMEQTRGRALASDEHVHHINGDKTDNRLENLELLGASEHHRRHMLEHWKAKRMSKLGHTARWGTDATV